ncbi:MAG: hypothetical protein HYR62_10730 [Actinobacteria bacterium]|nr:hypothetical protein [Actinomycetota bacterium]
MSGWIEPALPVLMWEVRAAPGRLADLVRHVAAVIPPGAEIYRSPTGDGDERLVVVDPARAPVPDLPSELTARPPYAWEFERVL